MGKLDWRQCLGVSISFFPFWWKLSFKRWRDAIVLCVGPFSVTFSLPINM